MSGLVQDFATLFAGRRDALGLGRGGVVRRPVREQDYLLHLKGIDDGLGIFPLRDDGTVSFAAIDLDRPDFELARILADLLPGTAWIERSRSGNAHVWVFFAEPIEAWVARGVMRSVLKAVGEPHVEVFPKQDRLLPGSVGNYINLPYHGSERPILAEPNPNPGRYLLRPVSLGYVMKHPGFEFPVLVPEQFVREALETRNDPEVWRERARAMGVESPEQREARRTQEFGTSPVLHECAEYIVHGALTGERPIREGHRSVVYFNLTKQLLNWSSMDEERAWELVQELNATSPDPLPERELQRIFNNAASGRWTSTGCDDPVMAPYVSPTCPIAGA